jgi:hypothetical protein
MLHNEELHNLYSSESIIVMKSRRMRWTGLVASVGELRNKTRFWLENLKGRIYLGDQAQMEG